MRTLIRGTTLLASRTAVTGLPVLITDQQ